MRKLLLILVVVITAAALSLLVPPSVKALQETPKLSFPGENGVFYKSPSGWVRLTPVTMNGGGMKHTGKMFIPGLTPQIVWTFPGASAPLQISEKRPTFFVKRLAAVAHIPGQTDRDILVVRLDKKKDHRELQITSGGSMFTFKAGFSKEKLAELTINPVAEGSFSFMPSIDLKPGEYLIGFSYGSSLLSGFDFAVLNEDIAKPTQGCGITVSCPGSPAK